MNNSQSLDPIIAQVKDQLEMVNNKVTALIPSKKATAAAPAAAAGDAVKEE